MVLKNSKSPLYYQLAEIIGSLSNSVGGKNK